MSYRTNKINKGFLKVNDSYEGESIEIKVQRLVKNKEPLDGSVPLTYTERKDGVKPEHNIRTDRWEIAAEAMNVATRSRRAQRDNKGQAPVVGMDGKTKDGGEGGTGTNDVGKA